MLSKSVINLESISTTDTPWLKCFLSTYQNLNKNNLHIINDIYHRDIQFTDPLHQTFGLDALINYFTNMYHNITYCQFDIHHIIEQKDEAAIYWDMHFSHPRLNKGKQISVSGHSHLRCFEGKVIYHRDHLDAGAMLYEHIPLLGRLIAIIKNRANQ
jgi:hypothetical protein